MSNPLQTNSSKMGEIKSRLIFVLLGLFVYRLGAHIPVPGLNPERLADLFSQANTGILGLFNLFSGGALSRFTVFALGVMPYISASIIVQLMSIVSPALESLKKEGAQGRRKLTFYTRVGTVILAIVQGLGIAKYMASSGIALYTGVSFYLVTVITLATGTIFLMWLGEQITERGIGNGISLIIFSGIVAGLPTAFFNTVEQVRQGVLQPITLIILVLLFATVIYAVVFVERAQRRIPIQHANRQAGRQVSAASKSHLPLKLNMAGVIPPIFASSLILFPATIAQWFSGNSNSFLTEITLMLSPGQPVYIMIFASLILFFSFFYTALVFNPKETADMLKKSGAFIPGIRPGESTALYIDKIMSRLTLVGACYITLVALLPEFLVLGWNVPFYFGGTSLLIVVVVVMDFMAQIQAHVLSTQYKSVMKKHGMGFSSLK